MSEQAVAVDTEMPAPLIFTDAVAAKVAVLLLIVLIIQRRPQGLFALKTRS